MTKLILNPRRLCAALLAILMLFTAIPAHAATHIPDQWARPAVDAMTALGVFDESSWYAGAANMYKQPLARSQAVMLLMATWDALGGYAPKSSAPAPFTDIAGLNTQARGDITRAYNLGLVTGVSETIFNPGGTYDRESCAVIAVRMYEKLTGEGRPGSTSGYADASQISNWARDFVGRAKGYGLMQGTGTGFAPKTPITLQQGLQLFLNLHAALSAKAPLLTADPEDLMLAAYTEEVLRLTNVERAKAGLSDLSAPSAALSEAAFIRAEEIITLFDHRRPDGTYVDALANALRIPWRALGENIAMGSFPTPESVVKAWMESPGHRANILSNSYNQLGVGVTRDSRGSWYWVQVFVG